MCIVLRGIKFDQQILKEYILKICSVFQVLKNEGGDQMTDLQSSRSHSRVSVVGLGLEQAESSATRKSILRQYLIFLLPYCVLWAFAAGP